MFPKSPPKIQFSSITSLVDGQDLGDLVNTWKDTAISEARLKMITVLRRKNLGFNEIQQFGLGLRYGFKSERMQDNSDKPLQKVIQVAMEVKKRDEIQHIKELKREKEDKKKWLAKIHHPKTKKYKTVVQYLRQEAEKAKRIQNDKYWKKIKHLENKYKIEKEEDKMPPGMEGLSHLKVFSEEEYKNIEKDKIEVPIIGDIEITPEEEIILRKNPKFALPERLMEDTMREDMEKAYSLMRMELKDETTEDIGKGRETARTSEEDEERDQRMRDKN